MKSDFSLFSDSEESFSFSFSMLPLSFSLFSDSIISLFSDSDSNEGASTSAIDKLVKNGSFVVGSFVVGSSQ